jgi:hypothetical protein
MGEVEGKRRGREMRGRGGGMRGKRMERGQEGEGVEGSSS